MLRHLILLIALTAFGATFAPAAFAQTFRMRCSSTSDGRCVYREVYEYDYVSVKPMFPGGDSKMIRYVNETREYPREAYRRGISGRVTCSFVVNVDGSITDIHVLKGVEPSLNREAVRIIRKMPAWVPGRHGGQCVPVRVIRSISFRR